MPSPKRAEEGLPNSNTETESDNDEGFNGMLARNPGNLAVTSSLHPFWHTKRGKAVIGLVVLTVIGAIVGGAIGGVKAHANMRRQIIDSSPASATTTTSLSSSSCVCSPSVAGAVFSTKTGIIVWTTVPGMNNNYYHYTSPYYLELNINSKKFSAPAAPSPFRFLHTILPPLNLWYNKPKSLSWLWLYPLPKGRFIHGSASTRWRIEEGVFFLRGIWGFSFLLFLSGF